MGNVRSRDSGVTLIEILVVLALIGVSVGVVTYALPSGSRARTLNQEAALLAARLNLAAERSLINGQHYRLDWQVEGYGFETWQDGEWQRASGAPLTERHSLESGAMLTDDSGSLGGVLYISPNLLPDEAGVVRLRLEAGELRRIVTFDGATAQNNEGAQ